MDTLWLLIAPIIVGIILLIIEYRTQWFAASLGLQRGGDRKQQFELKRRGLKWWITIMASIIALVLLVLLREEIWHRLHPPHPTIVSISYKINNEDPAVVATSGDIIEMKTGEELCLIDLTYFSLRESPQGAVAGEAYIRKGGRTIEDIDWKDGRFTGSTTIKQGTETIGDFKVGPVGELNRCWRVHPGWNLVYVYLMHYYPYGHAVDDVFFLALALE